MTEQNATAAESSEDTAASRAPLPEAAVAFFVKFHQWCLTLNAADAKEILPILQALRAAHVPESHVSRTS